MAKLNVNIVKGGLNRQSANQDTWGGLFVEVDALPVGWVANEVKRIFKPEDLESFGIVEDSANDNYKLAYWHVSEAFRLAPNATLYVQLGVTAASGTVPATIMTAFKNFEDRLRLFSCVFSTDTLDLAGVTALQDAVTDLFDDDIVPARAIGTWKKDAGDLIPDFSAATNDRVMVDIANDITVGGLAKTIFDSALGMCGAGGMFLGQLLLLSVHQKPSWRSFPVNGEGRWSLLGDINGDSVEEKTQTEIDAYDTEGVNLVVRTKRSPEAFISNARMAIATSDDYAVITHGRVIDKAIVLAYDGLVSALDGPIYTNESGEIVAETVQLLTRSAYDEINNNMVIGRTGNEVEVVTDSATGSLPLNSVFIDPAQDVLTTEEIVVQISITPVGAAKTITVNIGLSVPQ